MPKILILIAQVLAVAWRFSNEIFPHGDGVVAAVGSGDDLEVLEVVSGSDCSIVGCGAWLDDLGVDSGALEG
jgi:hypothetical protein